MKAKLDMYKKSIVPPFSNKPDPAGNPKNFNGLFILLFRLYKSSITINNNNSFIHVNVTPIKFWFLISQKLHYSVYIFVNHT
jgi:hypothetical protein